MNMLTDTHDPVTANWAASLLHFWFNQAGPERWYQHEPAFDRQCVIRCRDTWEEKRALPPEEFLGRADDALAAVLLFDQLPRNMFRGTAHALATDGLARAVARGAIAQGYDIQIGGAGRLFFYMPFQHSEDRDDQALSLSLFEAAGDAEALDFARRHHDIIHRFGRFPHRNAILGRETLAEERDAAHQGLNW
ncbi:DUF924 family protein [Sphingobium mellinum]|uniref:DUF924 family protein n=1 Tax=Sphingobium mellinum TaxID=1387166 RepID=UPI0030EE3AE3